MSNERIDLTQFEGYDEGPWKYSEPSECIFGPLNEKLDHYPILVNFPPHLYGVTTGEEYNNHPEVLKHRKVTKDGKVYHTESFWWGDRIPAMRANLKLMAAAPDLLAELKRCYEELDSLPTRWQMREIHDYTKWLETVESHFLADGSFNQDADFVRKCAVNDKYGYRIEVIDGEETVVHESEYDASE